MNEHMIQLPVRQLFGVPVHAATMADALALCRRAIDQQQRLLIGVVNAAKIVAMRRNALLRDSVCSADLVLADGMAVVWASRILGQRLPERVAGIDLFESLLALGSKHRYSAYFLGATQAVLDAVLQRVRTVYPGVRIVGSHNGYFGDPEADSIAKAISAAQPDMLFVAMTSPKKEIFLSTWGPHLGTRICHGVGGSFDVFAGKTRRAPRLWQQLGIEWLYRVWQEPGRLWRRYLVTNVAFVGLVLAEAVRRSRR